MFGTVATTTAGQVMASSGGGDGGQIGLLFFLSGFLFYGIMFMRYRNTDKRHMHARETEAVMDNVQASDDYLGERTRLTKKHIEGGNELQIEGSQAGGLAAGLMGMVPNSSSVRKIFTSFK